MRYFWKYKIVILLLLTALQQVGFAQITSINKHISWHSAQIKNIKLINQYGDIEIIHTDSDSVMIDATLSIHNLVEKDANEKLEMINIQSYLNDSTGNIKTRIDSKLKTSQPFNIDYIIRIPNKKSIYIENKFGNIYLDSIHVDLDISLSNGDVKTIPQTTIDELNADIEFSSLHINDAKSMTLQAKTSKVFANKVSHIKGNTEFSILNFNQAADVNLTTNYDAVDIKKCTNFELIAKTSSIHIENITGNVIAELNKGSLQLINFTDQTQNIEIISKSGNIEIRNGYKTQTHTTITHYYSDIDLGDHSDKLYKQHKNGSTVTVESKSQPSEKYTNIKIDSQYGMINIR